MNSLSVSLSYTRLLILFVAWYFVVDHPHIFVTLFVISHGLYIVQQVNCISSLK